MHFKDSVIMNADDDRALLVDAIDVHAALLVALQYIGMGMTEAVMSAR